METLRCIKERRSIRSFKPEPISHKVIEEILTAAINAPSSGNVQDWEFIIVKEKENKKKIAEAALGQNFISEAPVIIVVCSNLKRISYVYGQRGKYLYSIQNTAAAIENILLSAWDKGLGSCWVGAFNEIEIKKILNLPNEIRPLAIIPIGYPKQIPPKSERRDLKEVIHYEEY